MEIVEKAEKIRDNLKKSADNPLNPIDGDLKAVPPFIGNAKIKLIVIGQDPTIRNESSRKNITCTLNLDKENALKKYIERICALLEITIDNVYATNLFKYFYTKPPADTMPVLEAHLAPNLELLKEEIGVYADIPVITLGEPLLKLLTTNEAKVSEYWDYNKKTKATNCRFACSKAGENKLCRDFFPFPHQPSIRKEFYDKTLGEYAIFMRNKF